MMRILAIARNTVREAVRERLMLVLGLFGFALLLGSQALSPLALGEGRKVVIDFGLAGSMLLATLLSVFLGASLLHKELERRTVYSILAKPIGREEFILGKFLGLWATTSALLIAMAVILCAWSLPAQALVPDVSTKLDTLVEGVALAGQNGFDDSDPAIADQAADHIVQLYIHPLQGLLLMLHTGGSTAQMIGPQPQIILQTPNLGGRHKPRLQQPVRMQRRSPLTVLHVGLAPRQIASLLSVDHADLQARALQHPVERQPVNTRCFHYKTNGCIRAAMLLYPY